MIDSPIWKDIEFTTSAATLDYTIADESGNTVHQGYTMRMPDQTGITININNRLEEYVTPDFDENIENKYNDVVTNGDAYKPYQIINNATQQQLETYGFLYDWSYEDRWTGQTAYLMTEPINGHLDPRMRTMFTMYNTGETTFNWTIEFEEFIQIEPNYLEFEVSGGTSSVTITSNASWSLISKPDWITLSTTSSTGSYSAHSVTTITVTASSNVGNPNPKSGVIVIGSAEGNGYINVFQSYDYDEHYIMWTDVSSFTIDGDPHQLHFQASSETEWRVVSTPDWIRVSPGAGRRGVIVDVTAEVDAYQMLISTSRTGTIIFENARGYQKVVSVTQQSRMPYLIVTPTEFDFDYYDDSSAVTVTSNALGVWRIVSKPDWVTFTPSSGSSGTTNCTLSVTENMGSSKRTGEVVVANDYASVTLTVNQACFVGIIAYYDGCGTSSIKVANNVSNFRLMQVEGERPKTASVNMGRSGSGRTSDYWIRWSLKNDVTAPSNGAFYSIDNSAYTEDRIIGAEIRCPDMSDSLFRACTGMTFVILNPDFYTQDIVPVRTFDDCWSLTGFTVPDQCVQICDYAFENCSSMTEFNFSSEGNLRIIGNQAMYNTGPLGNVVLPEGLELLGRECFRYGRLSNVIFPTTLLSLYSDQHFADCPNITEVVLDFDIWGIAKNSQARGWNFEQYDKEGNLASTFARCQNLQKVTYKNGAANNRKTVLTSTFSGCTSLTDIVYDNCEQRLILGATYQDCTGLENVYLPDNIILNGYSFSGCTALTSVTISEGVTYGEQGEVAYADSYAWFPDTGLVDVTIPSSIVSLGNSGFQNCDSLVSVTLPVGMKQLTGTVFYGCDSLSSINLEDTLLETFKGDVFVSCPSITSLTFPQTLTDVNMYVRYMTNLSHITMLATGVTPGNLDQVNIPSQGAVLSRDASYYGWFSGSYDNNRFPIGWQNVVNPDVPVDPLPAPDPRLSVPMTFEIISGGTLVIYDGQALNNGKYNVNGSGWTTTSDYTMSINVNAGDIVQVEWDDNNMVLRDYFVISGTCKCNVSGNVLSMVAWHTVTKRADPFVKMFKDFTGVVDASNLMLPYYSVEPYSGGTSRDDNGFEEMFMNCTNLVKGPVIMDTYPKNSYGKLKRNMFKNCESLLLVQDYDSFPFDGHWEWMLGVPEGGVFIKSIVHNNYPTDYDGIPPEWSVINVEDTVHYVAVSIANLTVDGEAQTREVTVLTDEPWTADTSGGFFNISASSGDSGVSKFTVTFQKNDNPKRVGNIVIATANASRTITVTQNQFDATDYLTLNIIKGGKFEFLTAGYRKAFEYSINGGEWVASSSRYTDDQAFKFLLKPGDKMRLRGDNQNYYHNHLMENTDVEFTVTGNIMSLIQSSGFENLDTVPTDAFTELFYGSNVTDASGLKLNSNNLGEYCYCDMFRGCTKLTKTPTLPAHSANTLSYSGMFYGCSSLNTIRCYALDNSNNPFNYDNWTYNVPATGTFYKRSGSSWNSGTSGIPSGWTVINV